MWKCPIGQGFETDGGYFINGLKKGGTRLICKGGERQRFAFVPTFCVFVKTEVVPIKMNSH